MNILYNRSVRNVNNQTVAIGDVLLSDYIDVYNLGCIRVRIVIDSMEGGTSIVLFAIWNNGVSNTGVFNKTMTEPGSFEIGFSRSDKDINTIINATMQIIGRARMGFQVIAFDKGEDILPWP